MAISDMLDLTRAQAGMGKDEINDDFGDLVFEKLRAQPPLDLSWNAIETCFKAERFGRIWCVQEIALAQDTGRPSYAIYGHIRMRYSCINQTAACIYIAEAYNHSLGGSIALPG